jgi:hypothetical protein
MFGRIVKQFLNRAQLAADSPTTPPEPSGGGGDSSGMEEEELMMRTADPGDLPDADGAVGSGEAVASSIGYIQATVAFNAAESATPIDGGATSSPPPSPPTQPPPSGPSKAIDEPSEESGLDPSAYETARKLPEPDVSSTPNPTGQPGGVPLPYPNTAAAPTPDVSGAAGDEPLEAGVLRAGIEGIDGESKDDRHGHELSAARMTGDMEEEEPMMLTQLRTADPGELSDTEGPGEGGDAVASSVGLNRLIQVTQMKAMNANEQVDTSPPPTPPKQPPPPGGGGGSSGMEEEEVMMRTSDPEEGGESPFDVKIEDIRPPSAFTEYEAGGQPEDPDVQDLLSSARKAGENQQEYLTVKTEDVQVSSRQNPQEEEEEEPMMLTQLRPTGHVGGMQELGGQAASVDPDVDIDLEGDLDDVDV